MASKRKLKAEIKRLRRDEEQDRLPWWEGWWRGFQSITPEPALWQEHLARVANLAEEQGYERGYRAAREASHAPESASERKDPEWLTAGDDYRESPMWAAGTTSRAISWGGE